MSLRSALAYFFCLLLACLIAGSCGTPGGLFKKRSPHQAYAQRLKDANLHHTAMGKAWLSLADSILKKPVSITLPYKETGYFPADRVQAAAFRFEAKEGEKLTITVNKRPVNDFSVYIDLLEGDLSTDQPDLLAFADTAGSELLYEVEDSDFYLLRLQPELLGSGEYTLSITNGPSLAYPIKAIGNNHIQSFWGDGRDANNSRKHEGIDLFAPFHTPVIAAAEGVITSVHENRLGGKVVWLRPQGKNYGLYYAHLDTQLVTDGQRVLVGDTLGLMGNSGNARTTPPHLHFGIYTFGGAIDPFPFVNRSIKSPAAIEAPLGNLNTTVRTRTNNTRFYPSPGDASVFLTLPVQTTLLVEAAYSSMYKATLPDGRTGYIDMGSITKVWKPLRKYRLPAALPLLDQPLSSASRKTMLAPGKPVEVLGSFQNYYLVDAGKNELGWISK